MIQNPDIELVCPHIPSNFPFPEMKALHLILTCYFIFRTLLLRVYLGLKIFFYMPYLYHSCYVIFVIILIFCTLWCRGYKYILAAVPLLMVYI